jgi:ring-1,2-phenylacetyl-CoA epoxidase subunit PaaE
VLADRLPRSWNAALQQLGRDLRVVGRRAKGHGLPPLVARRPRVAAQAEPGPTRATNERELVVERFIAETPSTFTLVLVSADGAAFEFRPGQFFTVIVELDGVVLRRNYSASNAPGDRELHLTIKRHAAGKVSPLLGAMRDGERLRVMGPFGSFVVAPLPSPDAPRRLVLVAGGAGITPLASIARDMLAREPEAELALVYGSRHDGDVIFRDALDALALAHPTRFTIVHLLEEASTSPDPRAAVGRLDRATTARVLDGVPLASHPAARFFVCGPDAMRDEVLAALEARGVSPSAIAMERFTIGPRPQVATSSAEIASTVAPGARPVTIRAKGREHRTTALPGATVLEAGLAAGAPMPFSCAVGGCGACKVKLIEGSVEVEEPNCLSDQERAAGYVLTCVGRPCGPCTIEVLEEAGGRDVR